MWALTARAGVAIAAGEPEQAEWRVPGK